MEIIKAQNIEQAIGIIKEKYKGSRICVGDLLADVEIHGLSVENVVKVYAELYEAIEGDEICRVDEDGMRYSIGTWKEN